MSGSTVALGQTARQIILSSRPLSWINTAFPFAAAMVVVTGRVDALLVVGTLFFLVPYNLLMYGVNDVFDYESDLRNPRKGGAEGALLDPRLHRSVMLAGIVSSAVFVAGMIGLAASSGGGNGHPLAWFVLAVSLFAVVAYSVPGLRLKERPVLDSITSSTHFASPAVFGLVLAGASFTPGLVALLVAFFFWGMASHAFGAVQDVAPDREAGIASIATALGAKTTVRVAIGLWAVAGGLMLATDAPGRFAALLAVPYIVTAWPWRSVDDEHAYRANAGWRRFLWLNYASGFVVTLLLIVWVAGR